MCLFLRVPQERGQKENANKICRAPGYRLGSEFQVLQNSLKNGELFPPMCLDKNLFTFFLVSLWVHCVLWAIFSSHEVQLSLQLVYGPPCRPHAVPWRAVGEPCRSSTRRWRRDVYRSGSAGGDSGHLLGDRPGNPMCCWASTSNPSSWFISGTRGVSCPGSWEGARGHAWR